MTSSYEPRRLYRPERQTNPGRAPSPWETRGSAQSRQSKFQLETLRRTLAPVDVHW